MRGVADQQHAAGDFRHRHHLTDHALVADDRLAFIDAVVRPFVDHHLIAIRIGTGGDHLGDHLVFVLTQRRTQQLAQAGVFLLELAKKKNIAVFQQQFLPQSAVFQLQLLAGGQRL